MTRPNSTLPLFCRDESFNLLDRDTIAAKVLSVIREHPDGVTRNEIERITGMRINTISGRVKELQEKGYIIISGTAIDPITGRQNSILRIA
jgi:hypothetical protein